MKTIPTKIFIQPHKVVPYLLKLLVRTCMHSCIATCKHVTGPSKQCDKYFCVFACIVCFFFGGGIISKGLGIGMHVNIHCHCCRNQIAWRWPTMTCCCTYCSYDSQSSAHWVTGAGIFTLVFDVLFPNRARVMGGLT